MVIDRVYMSFTSRLAKNLTNYSSHDSVGSKLRKRRLVPLLAMIDEIYRDYGTVRIIDIGGTRTYWNILDRKFLDEKNVHITLVNLPGSGVSSSDPRFACVEADGCDLSQFADRSFHIAHSNSVVEHVGDWERMVLFARETSRVADKYFVQTPNFWFPIEPHCMTPFFHWLPKGFRILLVRLFSLGHWDKARDRKTAILMVDRIRLLNKNQFRVLFKDAQIFTERALLLPKCFVAVRN